MSDPYRAIREHLEHIQELITFTNKDIVDYPQRGRSITLLKAVERKIMNLVDEIKAFSGDSSDKAAMEIIRWLRALMEVVADWEDAFEELDTALDLMYDLLGRERKSGPASKSLCISRK